MIHCASSFSDTEEKCSEKWNDIGSFDNSNCCSESSRDSGSFCCHEHLESLKDHGFQESSHGSGFFYSNGHLENRNDHADDCRENSHGNGSFCNNSHLESRTDHAHYMGIKIESKIFHDYSKENKVILSSSGADCNTMSEISGVLCNKSMIYALVGNMESKTCSCSCSFQMSNKESDSLNNEDKFVIHDELHLQGGN